MTTPCFSSVNSGPIPNQPMVPEVLNPIKVVQTFTLLATNYISSNTSGTFTFIQWVQDHLETTTNVILSTTPLDKSFQFIFQKIGCKDQDPVINYGDRVQLVTYDLRISQCALATCSTIDPNQYGGCATDSWQTFFIESVTGKTGPVCFNDQIRISQTTGDNCDITPGASSGVFCTAHNSNKNSILTILPVGGSLYVNPAAYVAQYASTQQQMLCENNPLDPSCISGGISNWFSSFTAFFSKIGTILLIIGIIFLISIMCLVFYYIRQGLSVFETTTPKSKDATQTTEVKKE